MNFKELQFAANELVCDMRMKHETPQEAAYVLFITHLILYEQNKEDDSSVEDFMKDYSKDFVKFYKNMRGLQ